MLIESNIIRIISILKAACPQRTFHILTYSKKLCTIELDDSAKSAVQKMSYEWSRSLLGGTSQQFRQSDANRSCEPTKIQKVSQYLVDAMSILGNSLASTTKSSLAWIWWLQLCQEASALIIPWFNTNPQDTINSFVANFVSSAKRPLFLHSCEWALYSVIFHKCLASNPRMWLLGNFYVIVRRCHYLFSQLCGVTDDGNKSIENSSDSGNISTSLSNSDSNGSNKSLIDNSGIGKSSTSTSLSNSSTNDKFTVMEGIPLDRNWFLWFQKIKGMIENDYKCITERNYNKHTCRQYIKEKHQLVKSFNVFPATTVKDGLVIPSVDDLYSKLEEQLKAIRWLQNHGVSNLDQQSMQMLQRVQEDECLWYHDLCSALGAAGAMLKPLQCTLQPISPAVDFVTGCTVYNFLQYFLSTKTSALFSAVLAMYCQPESQCALEEMVSKLQASHTFMCSILLSEVSVKSLHLISKQIGHADMKAGVLTLISFPLYSIIINRQAVEELIGILEQCFAVLKYLSWARTLLEVFKTYGKISSSGDNADDDIDVIQDLLMVQLDDLSAKKVIKLFSRLDNLLKNLDSVQMELVEEVQKQSRLITFLTEFNLCTDPQLFSHLRERLTSLTLGDSIESRLLIYLIASRECLAPFIQHQPSNLHDAICVVNELRSTPENIAHVRAAGQNLAHIQHLIRQAQSNHIENALELVDVLKKTGHVTIELIQYMGTPSTCIFAFRPVTEVGNDSQLITLSDEKLFALRQQLLFSNQSNNAMVRDRAFGFLKVMDAIDSLKETLFALERDGHPNYSACHKHLEFSLSSVSSIEIQRDAMMDELVCWRQELKQVCDGSNGCHILCLYTKSQIGHMLALLQPGNPRQACTQAMLDTRMENSSAHSSAQCATAILLSPQSILTEIESPESILDAGIAASSHQDSCQLLTALCKLINSTVSVKQDNVAHKEGKQYVYAPFRFDHQYQQRQQQHTDNALTKVLSVFLQAPYIFPCQSQLLFCTLKTTEEELRQFVSRATLVTSVPFVLIGIDRLNRETRSALATEQVRLSEHKEHADVYYILLDCCATSLPGCVLWDGNDMNDSQQSKAIEAALKKVKRPKVVAVTGKPGVGKSTYIHNEVKSFQCTITINGVPDYTSIIKKLNSLPRQATVLFSLSSHLPWDIVDMLFFNLLVTGSLISPTSGSTHTIPRDSDWKWWVEVPPPPNQASTGSNYLRKHLPMLALFAEEKAVNEHHDFILSDRDRLVARYTACYLTKRNGRKRINEKMEGDQEYPNLSSIPMGERDFNESLLKLWKLSIDMKPSSPTSMLLKGDKRVQAMFVAYLQRRFKYFEQKSFFRHFDLPSMGSDIFEQFIAEARYLCTVDLECSWRYCRQSFLVFDSAYQRMWPLYPECANTSRQMITAGFKRMTKEAEEILKSSSNRWEKYITDTFHLNKVMLSQLLREEHFVLTPDAAYKILMIHERKQARIPLVIEGETGTGKTFLLEFYANLLDEQAMQQGLGRSKAPRLRKRFSDWLGQKLQNQQYAMRLASQQSQLTKYKAGLLAKSYDQNALVDIWKWVLDNLASCETTAPTGTSLQGALCEQLIRDLQTFMSQCYSDIPRLKPLAPGSFLKTLIDSTKPTRDESVTLLKLFLQAEVHPLLWHQLVHPGVQPHEIDRFLQTPCRLATQLEHTQLVVFFDEVNTASCLGIYKEILVDHSLNGKRLPDNIFFVAAINPYTSSDAHGTNAVREQHVKTASKSASVMDIGERNYTVHELPASMVSFRWKYPGLDNNTELEQYIQKRLSMQWCNLNDGTACEPTAVQSQLPTILFAAHRFFLDKELLGSVSHRDIERVFCLIPFFQACSSFHVLGAQNVPGELNRTPVQPISKMRTSIYLAVCVVYYMRLPDQSPKGNGVCRASFDNHLGDATGSRVSKVFEHAVNQFVTRENFVIPPGVALNQALKENVFAIIACIQTKTPMCIIGAPGASKTLSFHIVRDNLLGLVSPKEFCQQFDELHCHFYQCSEYSNSNDIKQVLVEAERLQEMYNNDHTAKTKTRCVVLLDEAGLPSKNSMVLKVLHPFLDKCRMSFVAISNNHFDSANENRMVVVLRSLASPDDMLVLAAGCLGLEVKSLDEATRLFLSGVCEAYREVVKEDTFGKIYHCRDIIYLLRHIHHHQLQSRHSLSLSGDLLLRALEQNFNATDDSDFRRITDIFFQCVEAKLQEAGITFQRPQQKFYRSKMTILRHALRFSSHCGRPQKDQFEKPIETGHHLAPRFKLIVDPTDDFSGLRLLQNEGVISRDDAKVFRMSDLLQDQSDVHVAEVISGIKYCVEHPTTAILVNASRVFGSLYDLLNQSFLRIGASSKQSSQQDEATTPQAYANIAMGTKTYRCEVHASFQCIVFLSKRDFESSSAPFLSRFEKFLITPKSILNERIHRLTPPDQLKVRAAYNICQSFVDHMGPSAFYGYSPGNTLPSLLMSHIQPPREGDEFGSFCVNEFTGVLNNFDNITANCSEMQRLARGLCAQLLQLVTPETFVLKMHTLADANDYAGIYFHALESTCCDLKQLLENRTPESAKKGNKCADAAKALMMFTRTSSDMQSLQSFISATVSKTSMQHIAVENAHEFMCKRDVESRLQRFQQDSRTCLVVSIDSKKASDHRIWHQLITDNMVSCSESNKFFVMLFHIPELEVHLPSNHAATFLNNQWSCLFLDSVCQPPFNLRRLAGIIVRESQSCGDDNEVDLRETQKHQDFAELVLPTRFDKLGEELATRYRPCQKNRVKLPKTVKASCQRLYKNKGELHKQLQCVLDDFPCILKLACRRFSRSYSDRQAYKLMCSLARDLTSRNTSGSFAAAVDQSIQQLFPSILDPVLTSVCSNYGLVHLNEWSEETISCLVDLIPVSSFKSQQVQQVQLSLHRLVPGLPLFTLLRQRILSVLSKLHTGFNVDKARQLLEQDKIIGKLLSGSEASKIQETFCKDYLLLLLAKGSTQICEGSRELLSVQQILQWLKLDQEYQCQSAPRNLIAVMYWATEKKKEVIATLFQCSMTVGSIPNSITDISARMAVHYSLQDAFSAQLLSYSCDQLWKHLLTLAENSEAEEWSESLAKWVDLLQLWNEPDINNCLSAMSGQLGTTVDRLSLMRSMKVFLCGLTRPIAMASVRKVSVVHAAHAEQVSCQAFIQCMTSLATDLGTSSQKEKVILALLECVQFWSSNGKIQQADIKAIVRLLNGGSIASDVRYASLCKELSVQITDHLWKRDEKTTVGCLKSELSMHHSYTPPVYEGYSPLKKQPLADVLFFHQVRKHGEGTSQLSIHELYRRILDCGTDSSPSSLFHSVILTGLTYCLLQQMVAIISKQSAASVIQIDNAFRTVFNHVTSTQDFDLKQPSSMCLFFLKALKSKVSTQHLIKWLTKYNSEWCRAVLLSINQGTSEYLPVTFLSFMRSPNPPATGESTHIGFERAHSQYAELRSVFKKIENKEYSSIKQWISSQLSANTLVDGIPVCAWIKGSLLLLIFHDYHQKSRCQPLEALWSNFDAVFSCLRLSILEKKAFQFFLSKTYRKSALGPDDELHSLFDPQSSNDQHVMPQLMVNVLVCNLFFSQQTHWYSLITNPDSLKDSFYFGAVSYKQQKGHLGLFKIDCYSQFDDKGQPTCTSDSRLSSTMALLCLLFTFSSIFWHVALVGVDDIFKVVTKSYVEDRGTPGHSLRAKAMWFCRQRIGMPINCLVDGIAGRGPMSQEKSALLITRCLEKLVTMQYSPKHQHLFSTKYSDSGLKETAECAFQQDLCNNVLDRLDKFEANISYGDLAKKIAHYPGPLPPIGITTVLQAMQSNSSTAVGAHLNCIRHFFSNLKELELLAAFPDLLVMMEWLQTAGFHQYMPDTCLSQLKVGVQRETLRKGMDAWNSVRAFNGGRIAVDCAAPRIERIGDGTPLSYISDMLPKVLKYLLKVQWDFYHDCTKTTSTSLDEGNQLGVELLDSQPSVPLEVIAEMKGKGALYINTDEVDSIVRQCSNFDLTRQTVDYDLPRLARLILAYVAQSMRVITYEKSRLLAPLQFAIHLDSGQKSLDRYRLKDDLPDVFCKPLQDHHLRLVTMFVRKLNHEQAISLMNALAKISNVQCFNQPTANSNQDCLLSKCIKDISGSSQRSYDTSFLPDLQHLEQQAPVRLGNISRVHKMVHNHIVTMGYLHADLPLTIRFDLQPENLKAEVQQVITQCIPSANVEQRLHYTEGAIQRLLECAPRAEETQDASLSTLGNTCDDTYKDLFQSLPPSVKCQNLAAVVTIVVQLSQKLHTDYMDHQARQTVQLWSDSPDTAGIDSASNVFTEWRMNDDAEDEGDAGSISCGTVPRK